MNKTNTTQSLVCFPPLSFVGILDQLTLAFEPFPTVAEILAAIDRANDCPLPERKETPILPLWEEPLWTEEMSDLQDMKMRGYEDYGFGLGITLAGPQAPACHYTQISGKSGFEG